MESEGYDYLICLSIETTEEDVQNSNHRFLYMDKTSEIAQVPMHPEAFPSTIEFDWCAYDLNSQLVMEEQNSFVKPPNMSSITEQVQKRTGIKLSEFETAISLAAVIHKVLLLMHSYSSIISSLRL